MEETNPASNAEIAVTNSASNGNQVGNTPTNNTTASSSAFGTARSRYGGVNSMGYGSMGYGGMGGMGMGMGRMGMGMGMGGMRGGMGQQNGPGGFQQEYHGFFNGLRQLLQISFSGFSLYAYGKIFASMVWKMTKYLASKIVDGGRWLLAFFIFNRYSTKIMNGVVSKIKTQDSAAYVSKTMFQGLLMIGALGLSILWFMARSNTMDEEELKMIQRAKRRRMIIEEQKKRQLRCKDIFTNLNRPVGARREHKNARKDREHVLEY